VVALVVLLRINTHQVAFDQEEARMQAQTANYDQEFISMVNRLESELAERANFPFLGGKDPMTGKTRVVVAPQRVESSKAPKEKTNKKTSKGDSKDTVKTTEPSETPVVQDSVKVVSVSLPDPVRLTAVIYDDFKKAFTAIMMENERSYSVEVGDKIRGRVTKSINAQQVILEDNERTYQYDISGNISNRVK
jgi:hypothetical protein